MAYRNDRYDHSNEADWSEPEPALCSRIEPRHQKMNSHLSYPNTKLGIQTRNFTRF